MMKPKSASKFVFITRWLPTFLTVLIAASMLVHGPIHQPAHYHEFANDHALWDIPNAADVLSNIGFALVGGWGLAIFWRQRHQPYLAPAWPGYFLFAGALVLTAIGSGFYHWAPDNARLGGIVCRLRWPVRACWRACVRKCAAMLGTNR